MITQGERINAAERATRLWRACLIALLAGSVYALFSSAPLMAQTTGDDIGANSDGAGSTETKPPVCRLGVNVNSDKDGRPRIDNFDTAPLRLGWYIDYRAETNPARPQDMTYAPMIRLEQTGADSYTTSPSGQTLVDTILALAGQKTTWYVSNEPDRIRWQDDIMPAVYAKAFHELRAQIKSLDPSAKVIAGSIVQATEVRMQYLDLILASHQAQYGEPMDVDGWAIHGFVLREASCAVYSPFECWGAEIPPGVNETEGLMIGVQQNDDFDIFTENIVRMRQWMADNGYRNRPLFLSEYGVLMPSGRFTPDFTPARVNEFMSKSFDYLLNDGVDDQIGYPQDGNRLVQQLSWYSISDNIVFNGYLYDQDNNNQLSPMGENYAAEAAEITDDLDFTPLAFSLESPIVVLGAEGQQTALLIVGVTLANAGHNLYPQAVPVRLYDGDPNEGGIVLANGEVEVAGCGREGLAALTVSMPWDGESSPPDNLSLYAHINPDGTVDEVDMSNNMISGILALDDAPVITLETISFLPLVSR